MSQSLKNLIRRKLEHNRLTTSLFDTPRFTRHLEAAYTQMYARYQAGEEYCVPSCGDIGTMPMADVTLFSSRDRAEAAGLLPCSSCRPDLHPLEA